MDRMQRRRPTLDTSQEMRKTSVVTNEDKVLLIGRKQLVSIRFRVFPPASEHVIPNRHKQCIIGTEEGMMTKVKLGSVEEVLERRVLRREDWVAVLDIHVSVGIDEIEQNEVGSNDCPVHFPIQKKWCEEGRPKYGNVHEVLVKVLHETCRR